MKYKYTVSFEQDLSPVKTFKGTVQGALGASARRAIEGAKGQSKENIHCRSVVIVLEKLTEPDSSQK